MRLLPLIILLFCAIPTFAQFEKIIHQSFELNEAIDLDIQVNGEYEVETWAGNVILAETKVQLYDASPSIFNYYLEKERYNLKSELSDAGVVIQSVDMERKPIRTKKGECYEFVKIRLFVPEDYVQVSDNLWRLDIEGDLPPVAAKEESEQ